MTHAVTQTVVFFAIQNLAIPMHWVLGIVLKISADILVGWMAYKLVEIPGRSLILRFFLGSNATRRKQVPHTQ